MFQGVSYLCKAKAGRPYSKKGYVKVFCVETSYKNISEIAGLRC